MFTRGCENEPGCSIYMQLQKQKLSTVGVCCEAHTTGRDFQMRGGLLLATVAPFAVLFLASHPASAEEKFHGILRCGGSYAAPERMDDVRQRMSKGCECISGNCPMLADPNKKTKAEPVRPSTSTATVVINRSPNSHFETNGFINGFPVKFMVDTGASFVSITDQLAQSAGIQGGEMVGLNTANGSIAARITRDNTVHIGKLTVDNVPVAVGLRGLNRPDQVLLGQSFLSKVDITVVGDKMTLSARK